MNAQEAYNKTQTFNKFAESVMVKKIQDRIELAIGKGLFTVSITNLECSKTKSYFQALGYTVSDWGDFRDSEDYRISWQNPKQ